MLAYELGYRFVPANVLSIDVSVFYNDYDNLRNFEEETPVVHFHGTDTYVELPIRFDNKLKGKTYGIELAAVWQAADWWRWDLAYSYLRFDIDTYFEVDEIYNNDYPQHQVSLRSAVNLGKDLDLDLRLCYVDDIKAIDARTMLQTEIDDYFTLDIRLAWRPDDKVEIALVGQNLLDNKHPEYVQETIAPMPTEIERGVYGKITWRF